MKETLSYSKTIFEAWWFQNNHFLPPNPELEHASKRVWEAARMNAIILLRIERTKSLELLEQVAIEKCTKVLEDNL